MMRHLVRGWLVVGLGAIVAGTFLPWMHSGATTRNSYQAGGVARRVLTVPAWLDTALRVWPYTAIAAAAVAAILLLGWTALAGGLGMLLSLGCGAVTAGTLSLAGNTAVSPAALGPLVTLTGAVVVLASSTLLLRREQDRIRRVA